jgi:hypothetical protein
MMATVLSVAGMAPTKGGPPPPPVDANPMDEAVVIVARDLVQHGQSLSDTERACLDGVLREQPALQEALRRAGDVERLELVDQDAVFGAAATCAPAAIGRALHTTFVTVSGMTSGRLKVQRGAYECLGDIRGLALTTMLHHPRRVPTSDGMEVFARSLYLCGTSYVTDGPLAQGLDVRPDVAACVADYVANVKSNLIPEVSRIMFGQAGTRRSKGLRTTIQECRRSTNSIARLSR